MGSERSFAEEVYGAREAQVFICHDEVDGVKAFLAAKTPSEVLSRV
jgi:hypothetical protein